jgi:hypothetical protein
VLLSDAGRSAWKRLVVADSKAKHPIYDAKVLCWLPHVMAYHRKSTFPSRSLVILEDCETLPNNVTRRDLFEC